MATAWSPIAQLKREGERERSVDASNSTRDGNNLEIKKRKQYARISVGKANIFRIVRR